jgi:hypothetical protein
VCADTHAIRAGARWVNARYRSRVNKARTELHSDDPGRIPPRGSGILNPLGPRSSQRCRAQVFSIDKTPTHH